MDGIKDFCDAIIDHVDSKIDLGDRNFEQELLQIYPNLVAWHFCNQQQLANESIISQIVMLMR